MNKVELVSAVVEKMANDGVKVTKKDMTTYVDAMVDVIKESMISGEDVKIANFGTFTVVERAARTGVNPQHPEVKIEIPASRAPKFKASGVLKSAIKG